MYLTHCNAPNTPTPTSATNNAPFTKTKGKGAKVGISRTHKAEIKFNPRNTRGA